MKDPDTNWQLQQEEESRTRLINLANQSHSKGKAEAGQDQDRLLALSKTLIHSSRNKTSACKTL